MVEDGADRWRPKGSGDFPDALAAFSELDRFDVYTDDGHSHQNACHDERVNETTLCVTRLYTRNLQNGWMTPLSLCTVKDKGHHHNMTALKSLAATTLRQGAKSASESHLRILDTVEYLTQKLIN